jgi:hypothetical protein
MARAKRLRQAGFMYLEVLLGILLLAIVAGGVIEGFAAASSQIGKTRLDVVASKIALQRLEDIRNMSYASIGTVGGNPPGTIPATQTQTVNGTTYTVQTSVKYVDDPASGQPHTFVDYKSVSIVVTPQLTVGLPVTESTVVAPPNYASMAGLSTAVVTVVDAVTLQPLPNMTVTIGGGPSATRTDLTSANGAVVFAGLTPNPTSTGNPQYNYTAQVTQAGYATDPTTAPSVTTAHLSASQTWQVTIKVFAPATLGVNLVDSVTGSPITNFSTVTVTAPAPQSVTDTQSGLTGTYSFTTLQGQVIEPSLSAFGITATADCYASQTLNTPVPAGYPNLTSQTVTFNMVSQGGGHLNATVLNNSTGQPIAGAQVQISGGQGNLAPVVRTTDSNGNVTFCELASGSTNYTVAAGASGYGSGSLSAAITDNGTTSVTLKLVAGATGTIRLTTTTSNLLVRLKASAGTYDVSQYTNSSRFADFINLAPGTYTAYVATSVSSGNPIWSSGKSVTAQSGKTLSYSVP